MQPFRIRRIEKFHQPRQAPRRRVQGQSAAQRLIQIGGFADGAGCAAIAVAARRSSSAATPLRNSTFAGVIGSCRGLKPVGTPFLKGRYSPPKCPHQDFKSAILVENHLSRALTVQHGDQEADEYRLARARWDRK